MIGVWCPSCSVGLYNILYSSKIEKKIHCKAAVFLIWWNVWTPSRNFMRAEHFGNFQLAFISHHSKALSLCHMGSIWPLTSHLPFRTWALCLVSHLHISSESFHGVCITAHQSSLFEAVLTLFQTPGRSRWDDFWTSTSAWMFQQAEPSHRTPKTTI